MVLIQIKPEFNHALLIETSPCIPLRSTILLLKQAHTILRQAYTLVSIPYSLIN